jgi:hypothetical protein
MATSSSTAPRSAPGRNRKSFLRTNVPFVERVVSWVIVGLLGVIGVAIWIQGHHFNPDQYALATDALKSTVAAVAGKAGTVRGSDARPEEAAVQVAAPAVASAVTAAPETAGEAGGGEESGEGSAAAAAPIKGDPLEVTIAGLKPMGDTEFYGPNNLFEKIDGRAPAYLDFNFKMLRCRTFSVVGSDGSYVDVFEYLFDTPINAFGMFALERDPKGKLLDFAHDGYAGDMGYFFRQGPRYVQIIASDPNASTMKLALALAENRAKNLPADDTGLDGRRRLPVAGLIPSSVAFVQENAQGQAFLKNVFQASYQFAGKKVPFFVMVTTPDEAAKAWKAFQDFSGKFGGKVTVLPDVAGAKVFQAENFGSWRVIYQRTGELGGAFDADDANAARQFVEQYLQGKIQ